MSTIFKGNVAHIIFLVALLAVIIVMMVYIKTSTRLTRTMPEFVDEPIKIIDNTYFNKQYHFSISLPNSDWELKFSDNIDTLRQQNVSQPLLDNINVMLEMYRRDGSDTLAVVQVGIIDLTEPRTPRSLAQQCLREIKSAVNLPDSVRVVKDVTLSAAGRLRGAYYVIEFSENLKYDYPVWVAMFFVYNKLAYTVICQVRSEEYGFLRSDFESILKSFRLFKA